MYQLLVLVAYCMRPLSLIVAGVEVQRLARQIRARRR